MPRAFASRPSRFLAPALTPYPAVLLALLTAQACAPARTIPEERAGPLEPLAFVAPDGSRLHDARFVARAAAAHYVLVGETHDDACHHRAQARALDLLARTPEPPAVGLEMIAVDRQSVLDLFNDDEIAVDALSEGLDWEAEWGVPFEQYAPIFRVARNSHLPVFALNAPRRLVYAAADGGIDALPEEDRALLPPEIVPPPEEQQPMLLDAFAVHGAKADLDEHRVRRFFFVQSLWDSMMAHRAVEVHRATDRPVVILTGSGHVVHGWGIPHRLRVFDPDARIFTVLPWDGRQAPEAGAADAFYFCPARARKASDEASLRSRRD